MVRKEPAALCPERVSRAENPRSSGVWKRMPPNDWASPDCRARTPQLLDMLRKVEKRGVNETARRLKQLVGQIFRFAIVTGRAKRDPSSDLKEALRATGEPQRHRAMPLLELPTFLQQSETPSGASWKFLDEASVQWRIPAERMKMRLEHLVPLSRQAVAVLREQRSLAGNSPNIFPSLGKRGIHVQRHDALALYRWDIMAGQLPTAFVVWLPQS